MRGAVTSASRTKWPVRDRSMWSSSPGQGFARGDVVAGGGVRRLFERLGGFARLIIFDKRGTGMSDRSRMPSLEVRMDDVRAVMDAAGSERAAISRRIRRRADVRPVRRYLSGSRRGDGAVWRVGEDAVGTGLSVGTPEAEYCSRSRMSVHTRTSQGQTRRSRDRGLPMPAVTRSPRWRVFPLRSEPGRLLGTLQDEYGHRCPRRPACRQRSDPRPALRRGSLG